jgi:hypothetical protein
VKFALGNIPFPSSPLENIGCHVDVGELKSLWLGFDYLCLLGHLSQCFIGVFAGALDQRVSCELRNALVALSDYPVKNINLISGRKSVADKPEISKIKRI